MTLTELRYLVALARERHFGRAAEACQVSQPTLSAAIRKLEEHLGMTLFERRPREVRVTHEAEPIIAWERKSRELLVRPVPVVIGMPGVTSIRQLLRYAKICGVQASAAFLTGHAATMITMLRQWSPNKLVEDVSTAVAEDLESRIERFHFFPFGALDRTVSWVSDMVEITNAQNRSAN